MSLYGDESSVFIIEGVPKGSTVGIDGSYNVTLSFDGWKLIPPGLHSFLIQPTQSSSSTFILPTRSALFTFTQAAHTLIKRYNTTTESIVSPSNDTDSTNPPLIISQDHLKTLDKTLAPYPFDKHTQWKNLTKWITKVGLTRVLGPPSASSSGEWQVDGWAGSEGDEDDDLSLERTLGEERVLRNRKLREEEERRQQQEKRESGITEIEGPTITTGKSSSSDPPSTTLESTTTKSSLSKMSLFFPQFDIRKSWRSDAPGEEITLFAYDKSWLLCHVVIEQLFGDPFQLLSDLSLSWILFTTLSLHPALQAYKRTLTLLTHSLLLLSPSLESKTLLNGVPAQDTLNRMYLALVVLLSSQLGSLEDGFFREEAQFEDWVKEQIGTLGRNLRLASAEEEEEGKWAFVVTQWDELGRVVNEKFGWTIPGNETNEEDEEEDEEDLPVVVDL